MLSLVHGFLRGEVLKQRQCLAVFIQWPYVVQTEEEGGPLSHPLSVFIARTQLGLPSKTCSRHRSESFKIQLLSMATKAQCRLVGGMSGHPVPN